MSIPAKPKLIRTLLSNTKWVGISICFIYFLEKQPLRSSCFPFCSLEHNLCMGCIIAYLLNSRHILAQNIWRIFEFYAHLWLIYEIYTEGIKIWLFLGSKPKHDWCKGWRSFDTGVHSSKNQTFATNIWKSSEISDISYIYEIYINGIRHFCIK